MPVRPIAARDANAATTKQNLLLHFLQNQPPQSPMTPAPTNPIPPASAVPGYPPVKAGPEGEQKLRPSAVPVAPVPTDSDLEKLLTCDGVGKAEKRAILDRHVAAVSRARVEEARAADSATIIELRSWKVESMQVFIALDLQEIGKALGLPLGRDIAPLVLPGIRQLQAAREKLAAELEQVKQLNNQKWHDAEHGAQMRVQLSESQAEVSDLQAQLTTANAALETEQRAHEDTKNKIARSLEEYQAVSHAASLAIKELDTERASHAATRKELEEKKAGYVIVTKWHDEAVQQLDQARAEVVSLAACYKIAMDAATQHRAKRDKLAAVAKEMAEALEDVESKIVDFVAGKINWRPDDFLFRVRAALTRYNEAMKEEKA